jgi:glutaredoxin
MLRIVALLLLGTGALGVHAGQLYRWVDSAGHVSYSDQPPPAGVKQVQDMSRKPKTTDGAQSDMDTLLAKDKNPVILYANECGPLCDKAQAFLKERGIPFTRKDPARDSASAQELRKLTGVTEVPVVRIGKTHMKGFDASSWSSVLEAAGYPAKAPTNAPANAQASAPTP